MATATRGGRRYGTIFHSDRGSEYTPEAYNTLLNRLGVVQSMGRLGSALDNAAAESFNSLTKVEYIHPHHFATRTEARLKIATLITGFYNPRRRHSAAGGLPPEEFEQTITEAREVSTKPRV
ncbi:integrase core domain-containing protein [Streptomyces globisporus]|uniref:integrase core domain-containing protein n=1 Tax=Streptomyces globisporus TaxID=1908 RepID=UPI0038681012|nr:integrase core domain-containing protein [Streptomyces globisporus]